ncbi:Baculovirus repeated ORF 9 [Trabala vishnou gigantina nucleopolyhedrovirus]|uniref:Baculovirus repeated ORF 9 n=1 Tax=Trabala vishnou gigantina nucleopolyhedrovirus TaxID=2863583 RepID=UPI002481BD6F|nr:Baculovirus repeated ORF 9 [Trabala vishnou gigantina nucleopolyhedrovirus]QYC92688.1 Baculovirus repeated ORF 9 [Trabala vishnou gigantina nucleopolyhedrovirus]
MVANPFAEALGYSNCKIICFIVVVRNARSPNLLKMSRRVVNIGDFKFGEDTFRLRYVVEKENGLVKFVAKDIAKALNYVNCKQAVIINVDEKYKFKFEQGSIPQTPGSTAPVKQGDSLYLQPHTILITKEGVIQLIMKSKLPYAVELQAWLLEEVIPQVLCTGKYQPALASNDIEIIKCEKEQLVVCLKNANEKLAEANDKIIHFANALVAANAGLVQANTMLNESRKDSELARKETAELANRMADIAQDVITKPNNPQLCHSLAVCSLGGDQYAFLRPQRRNLKRSLNRLSVDNREIVYKSDYVPNAMNVLNKVKESLPKDKYKAKHNKITLLEDLTKEDLVEAIDRSLTQRQVAIIVKNANFNNKIEDRQL